MTLAADKQQQRDELSALEAIYGDDCVIGPDLTTCQVSAGHQSRTSHLFQLEPILQGFYACCSCMYQS